MSRGLRVEFDGAIYHVMSRGVGRMRTFLDDDDREVFLDMVGRVVAEEGWIMTVHREAVNQPFGQEGTRLGPPVNVPGYTSWAPRISPDGRWLYFANQGRSSSTPDIWVAWKSDPENPDAPFDQARLVPDINRLAAPQGGDLPGCVSPNGEEFFYVQGGDLRVARFVEPNNPLAGFMDIRELTHLNTVQRVFGPAISSDGRYLVWSDTPRWWWSDGPRFGGHGGLDLWMAVRPSAEAGAEFGRAINLPMPPNSGGDEFFPWLWDDGAGTVLLIFTNGSSLLAAPTGCFGADPGTRACFTVLQEPGEGAVLDAGCSTPAERIVSYAWWVGDGMAGEGPELELGVPGRYEVTLRITTEDGTCDYHREEVELLPDSRIPFVRGEANADNNLDIADAICVLGYLFGSANDSCKDTVAQCLDAADANDDGVVNIADPISLLSHLFVPDSPPPLEPFPDCGLDPTDDDGLTCEWFEGCEKP